MTVRMRIEELEFKKMNLLYVGWLVGYVLRRINPFRFI